MTNAELRRRVVYGLAILSLVAIAGSNQLHIRRASAAPPQSEKMPVFEVDRSWPQLPNGWITGHVPSVAVDIHDNVWLVTRPNTVPADQQAHASPPVLEYDTNGKFLQAWGGPGSGYDWPDSNHTIYVDYKDNVWITGSSPASASATKNTDDMVLKFTNKGKFLMQIGGRNKSNGNLDTKSVHLATDVFVWPKTNEVFVSDGYGNRRVIVFDANTGAFKRMWGAFGNPPTDWETVKDGVPVGGTVTTGEGGPPPAARGAAGGGGRGPTPLPAETTGPGPQQFGNETPSGGPTHSVQISNDGMVYVADRANRRIQVFTIEGKYITQVFINREGPNGQSAAGIAFSPDKAQQYMYLADYGNNRIVVVDRKSLQVLYQFGERSANPGDFQGVHHIAVDSKGNIYAGEVAPGARAQKFAFKGLSADLPPNALTGEKLAGQMASARAAIAAARGGGVPGPGAIPISTALFDEWTTTQMATLGNLGNYGNHNASVQHRDVGAPPEFHTGFSHILIFTSGSGNFIIGPKIVDGPDGKKVIQDGVTRKIVLGEVWHIPANIPHQVVPDPGTSGVNYFVVNINIPPAPPAATPAP
jgi:hypothetical protein